MQRPHHLRPILVLVLLAITTPLTATTVAPPSDLGAMARISQATVFARAEGVRVDVSAEGTPFTVTTFRTVEAVAGERLADTFEVRVLGGDAGTVGLAVPGAPAFEPGASYLLFLSQGPHGWQPQMMAYGLLQERADGFLESLPQAREISLISPHGRSHEPVGIYRRDALLGHLTEVAAGAPWDASRAEVGMLIGSAPEPAIHNAPAECRYLTYFVDGFPFRWFDYDTGATSSIFHTTPGQTGIAGGGVAAVQQGIAAWVPEANSAVRYTYAGSKARIPDPPLCDDGSAVEFGEDAVVFNDPCFEIVDLAGCSGTLAFGGAYFEVATTMDGGEPYHKALSPYVVVNNGTQCIGETSFNEMMTHELGHTQGFGHHTVADATMSAFLKADGRGAAIKATDRLCTPYLYSFFDVSYASPFWPSIEAVKDANITAGCGNGNYCPDATLTRAQMAVFVLVAKEGSGYSPPPCTTSPFPDVPAGSGFCPWIQELFNRGIVAGCSGGNYCPNDPVTRKQMSVFLLATLEGGAYVPPACASAPFGDVPIGSPFCPWIQELANRGITAGCGGGNYCPDNPNTRAQMAAFLVGTFSLPLP